ncbi:methionyl-tRNA formyltransferase [Acetobacter sp. AN02]|uniref:methionyl-tRNA formyltransferase n=1 Tax=Acetobacter sp. AN02 TaxID=2894186 RepID=UPI00243423CC|nr:methionyl-tRNA formyltransferase [Acetobacter sp. AN02]MDG6095134.1 methionyl-tRNA formyltransferase [Acetobacter sp. AN02]
MRIVFMGTPDFAVPALEALHGAGHEIVAVYSQPPRPAGRGQAERRSPVHEKALALGLEVRTPERLRRREEEHEVFRALSADVAVVAAYGLILPEEMLRAPVRGCLNIHASLLPRWRGASPIQSAILAGDTETGVTIMQMDAGLDTGAMLLEERVAITAQTTASSLHDALAEAGGRLITQVLDTQPAPVPQPAEGITYAERLTREDGRIDWSRDAAAIDRQVRALTPWPGTFTTLDGVTFKIGAVAPACGSGQPGEVLDDTLTVACGTDAVRILRIQRPGKGMMEADAFLRGHPLAAGTILGR